MLGWKPADYHAATIRHLFDALEGWNEAQGGGRKGKNAPSAEEVAELVKRYG